MLFLGDSAGIGNNFIQSGTQIVIKGDKKMNLRSVTFQHSQDPVHDTKQPSGVISSRIEGTLSHVTRDHLAIMGDSSTCTKAACSHGCEVRDWAGVQGLQLAMRTYKYGYPGKQLFRGTWLDILVHVSTGICSPLLLQHMYTDSNNFPLHALGCCTAFGNGSACPNKHRQNKNRTNSSAGLLNPGTPKTVLSGC